jgi:hypothetical protein
VCLINTGAAECTALPPCLPAHIPGSTGPRLVRKQGGMSGVGVGTGSEVARVQGGACARLGASSPTTLFKDVKRCHIVNRPIAADSLPLSPCLSEERDEGEQR